MFFNCRLCNRKVPKVSQGKVGLCTLNSWGGKINHLSMAHLLINMCTKNYWNWTTVVKIITGGWVVFLRHSVHSGLVNVFLFPESWNFSFFATESIILFYAYNTTIACRNAAPLPLKGQEACRCKKKFRSLQLGFTKFYSKNQRLYCSVYSLAVLYTLR